MLHCSDFFFDFFFLFFVKWIVDVFFFLNVDGVEGGVGEESTRGRCACVQIKIAKPKNSNYKQNPSFQVPNTLSNSTTWF